MLNSRPAATPNHHCRHRPPLPRASSPRIEILINGALQRTSFIGNGPSVVRRESMVRVLNFKILTVNIVNQSSVTDNTYTVDGSCWSTVVVATVGELLLFLTAFGDNNEGM